MSSNGWQPSLFVLQHSDASQAARYPNRHVFAQPFNLGPQPNSGANATFGYVNSTVDAPRVLQLEFRVSF